MVITSNRTREIHDALKRRCFYYWVDYPDAERELAILRIKAPGQTTHPPSRSTTLRIAAASRSTGAIVSMVSAVPAGEVIARDDILTNGVWWRMYFANDSFSDFASSSRMPLATSIRGFSCGWRGRLHPV